ncbi:hypothetical protein AB6E53_02265 [Vibrio breoganii]|uniref:Uncharacterized protein n=1 Tax=Vibrio breoganii TaxID=553239 RepID=A0AAP8SWM8_9VIBR|nr:hypothetical protein [Vibrio breoganii]PMP10211.1 hypothetical protein BCS93_11085 [Vibrio breoganii]
MEVIKDLPKGNWFLSAYTPDNWTDWVTQEGTIETITVCNVLTDSSVTVSMRLFDDSSNATQILAGVEIAPSQAIALNTKSLNLLQGQKLQTNTDALGAEFFASGSAFVFSEIAHPKQIKPDLLPPDRQEPAPILPPYGSGSSSNESLYTIINANRLATDAMRLEGLNGQRGYKANTLCNARMTFDPDEYNSMGKYNQDFDTYPEQRIIQHCGGYEHEPYLYCLFYWFFTIDGKWNEYDLAYGSSDENGTIADGAKITLERDGDSNYFRIKTVEEEKFVVGNVHPDVVYEGRTTYSPRFWMTPNIYYYVQIEIENYSYIISIWELWEVGASEEPRGRMIFDFWIGPMTLQNPDFQEIHANTKTRVNWVGYGSPGLNISDFYWGGNYDGCNIRYNPEDTEEILTNRVKMDGTSGVTFAPNHKLANWGKVSSPRED